MEEGTGEVAVVLPPSDVVQSGPLTAPSGTCGVQEEIAAVTLGVAELQDQIQQLQHQHAAAENQNATLRATLESERLQHQQQIEEQPPAILENGLVSRVQHLEQELQSRTEERENYKNRLQAAERQVQELEQAKEMAEQVGKAATADLAENAERAAVQETLEKLTLTLKEQTSQCERFERQNTQLLNQVKALKEVISVHKDLLAIRSLESDQLKTTIKLLEDHSKAEKERRSAVLAKMEAAVRLNTELKNEYETQLRIFQELREKYDQKLQLLRAENDRLHALIPPAAVAEAEPSDEPLPPPPPPLEEEEPVAEQ